MERSRVVKELGRELKEKDERDDDADADSALEERELDIVAEL